MIIIVLIWFLHDQMFLLFSLGYCVKQPFDYEKLEI